MKKIMFNDRYGLTQAVLEGRKTMTRRVIKCPDKCNGKEAYGYVVYRNAQNRDIWEVSVVDADEYTIGYITPKYQIGEVVAVAESYEAIRNERYKDYCNDIYNPFGAKGPDLESEPGWTNKMFVRADLMPYRIKITNIKVERLQDISHEDCLKEGILYQDGYFCGYKVSAPNMAFGAMTAQQAFAALIDKVSGEGTWDSNPYVFVYEFELMKGG